MISIVLYDIVVQHPSDNNNNNKLKLLPQKSFSSQFLNTTTNNYIAITLVFLFLIYYTLY